MKRTMLFKIVFLVLISISSVFAQDTAQGQDPNATSAKPTQDDQVLVESQTTSTQSEFGEVTGTHKYKYTCTSGADVREITVITQADNSVGVVYKKADSTKTIALAKNDPAYADLKAEKVKGNLETAGYSCTKE